MVFDFTPLHYSIGIGDFDMMKLLLKLGADIYLESEMGYSPMDLAILMGIRELFFIYMVIFLMFLNKPGCNAIKRL